MHISELEEIIRESASSISGSGYCSIGERNKINFEVFALLI